MRVASFDAFSAVDRFPGTIPAKRRPISPCPAPIPRSGSSPPRQGIPSPILDDESGDRTREAAGSFVAENARARAPFRARAAPPRGREGATSKHYCERSIARCDGDGCIGVGDPPPRAIDATDSVRVRKGKRDRSRERSGRTIETPAGSKLRALPFPPPSRFLSRRDVSAMAARRPRIGPTSLSPRPRESASRSNSLP